MRRTWKAGLIAAAAVVSLAVAGCTSSSSGGSGGGGDKGGSGSSIDTLKVGTFLDVTSWDPASADIGFDGPYLSAVYDPLVALDKNSQPVPGLATSWDWSSDRMTLTMHLRTGVSFSDGQKFDATAAVANLKHLQAGTTSAQAYADVSSFDVVDPNTIAIHLKERDDALLYFMGLGRSWMASPAAISAGTLKNGPVGSGPYTYDKSQSTPGSKYIFTKKSGQWNSATFPFSTVELYPITDATASMNAMLSGQLNVNFAQAADIPRAKSNGWNIASKVASWVGVQFIDRTGKQVPALGDKRVRQAISYAFDGAAILKAVGNGAGQATDQLFPVDSPVYDASLNSTYQTDMSKAKQLLTQAGYPNGFSLHMPMSPVFQAWQPAAQQTFKQLGIKVTWDNMAMADYQKNAPTYPMFLAVIAMDSNDMATLDDQIVTPQWYNPNPSLDADPQLASLVKQVQSASPDQQTDLLRQVNKELVDQAWFDVWYQADNIYFSDKGITVTPITGMMFPTLQFIQRG